jgi:hypothetical protein
MEDSNVQNPEDIWEALQTITGDTFIYHKGFKEEADVKDIFKFDAMQKGNQIIYQFSRFDFNPCKPAPNSPIRLNRAVVAFAWYVDPASDVIKKLKETIVQMNAKQAGIILPGA